MEVFIINNNHENLKTFKQKLKILKKIEKVQSGCKSSSFIELFKLQNPSNWKQTLEDVGALQVLEHEETVGILLEPEIIDAILKYLDLIGKEMELSSFAAMIESRKGTTGFLSGEKLTKETLELFEEHKKDIRKFLDDED